MSSRSTWRGLWLIVPAAVLLVGALGAIWYGLSDVLYSFGILRTTFIWAEYRHMTFGGQGNEFGYFSTPGDGERTTFAPIYIKFTPDKTLFIPLITKKDIASIASKTEESLSIEGEPRTHYYVGKSGVVTFSNELLLNVSFDDRDAFEISKSRNGEFVRLPIRRQAMIKMFGTPSKYRESYLKLI